MSQGTSPDGSDPYHFPPELLDQLRGNERESIVEQIDGVIALRNEFHLVEISGSSRAVVRGLLISASGFTDPAITTCRDNLGKLHRLGARSASVASISAIRVRAGTRAESPLRRRGHFRRDTLGTPAPAIPLAQG